MADQGHGTDRWWRGFDADILEALAPGSRVLDVGCGDGALVERLVAGGLEAYGVDPCAPAGPRFVRAPLEEAGSIGRFDAVCAVMSLHHAQLEPVLDAIRTRLRPGGRLLVREFAWEDYDERAAGWLARHDRSGTDRSVTSWRAERGHLHTGGAIRESLDAAFGPVEEVSRPHLARVLGRHDLEDEEQALIDEGALPAIGRRYLATRTDGERHGRVQVAA